MRPQDYLWPLITGLGLLGGIGLGLKALLEKKVLAANAANSNAEATAILTTSARELLEPLNAELKRERSEHVAEIEIERAKVRELRQDLELAMGECRHLRTALGTAHEAMEVLRRDLEEMQREADAYRRRIADLEARPPAPA